MKFEVSFPSGETQVVEVDVSYYDAEEGTLYMTSRRRKLLGLAMRIVDRLSEDYYASSAELMGDVKGGDARPHGVSTEQVKVKDEVGRGSVTVHVAVQSEMDEALRVEMLSGNKEIYDELRRRAREGDVDEALFLNLGAEEDRDNKGWYYTIYFDEFGLSGRPEKDGSWRIIHAEDGDEVDADLAGLTLGSALRRMDSSYMPKDLDWL